MTQATLKERKLMVLLADMCNITASRPTWQRTTYWCSNESQAIITIRWWWNLGVFKW